MTTCVAHFRRSASFCIATCSMTPYQVVEV